MSISNDFWSDNPIFSHFEPHSHNLLSRAFLHKSLEWAYEEEVRVVKDITDRDRNCISKDIKHKYSNSSGDWNQILIDNRSIQCLNIPQESFVKIYIGRYAYKNVTQHKTYNQQEFEAILQNWADLGIEVHRCEPDVNSWKLISQHLTQYR